LAHELILRVRDDGDERVVIPERETADGEGVARARQDRVAPRPREIGAGIAGAQWRRLPRGAVVGREQSASIDLARGGLAAPVQVYERVQGRVAHVQHQALRGSADVGLVAPPVGVVL
jgi:hypothetical protein